MQSLSMQLVEQKLVAFAQIQPEFKASFRFLQDIHGQVRLPSLSVADCVRYLHARWICESKSLLLSVSKTVKEYEGRRCLELLLLWQERQDTASIVTFLYEKLDMLPIADITRQIQYVRNSKQDASLLARLEHGRLVMLNRGFHLLQALDAIFTLSEEDLLQAVKEACTHYSHLPSQIERQLELLNAPLYSYVPHQTLAQKNMLVMNALGLDVTSQPAGQPINRSRKVNMAQEVLPPYAEEIIEGYQDMTSTSYNNVLGKRFLDPPTSI
jgi:hypothetical protein